MSWIRIAGKSLEFSGKIIQSASFEAWAESKGREIIEKTAQQRAIGWFGKQRAARKLLWEDLKLVTQKPALHATLNRLASAYPRTIAQIASAFESNRFIADERTYVVPRFAVNPLHRTSLEQTLSTSDEFQKIKGGSLLQSYFYDEFVEQLDAAFGDAGPKPDDPVRLDETDWYVVGMNTEYDWRFEGEKWQGHFFLHGSIDDLLDRKIRKTREAKIKKQISSLDDQMGRFSREEKQRIAAPWVEMRDDLLSGRKVERVPPLMAKD